MSDTGAAGAYSIVEERELGRFQLFGAGGLVAFASYRERDGAVLIPHVETLWDHRGKGYAGRLMDGIVDILRSDGRTMVPLCPFAAAYMREHPEHRDLLQPDGR